MASTTTTNILAIAGLVKQTVTTPTMLRWSLTDFTSALSNQPVDSQRNSVTLDENCVRQHTDARDFLQISSRVYPVIA